LGRSATEKKIYLFITATNGDRIAQSVYFPEYSLGDTGLHFRGSK